MKNILVLFFSFIFINVALSTPSYQSAFVSHYSNTNDSQLNSCATCHIPMKAEFLNDYGLAVKEHKFDFKAIEELDSDGDGKTNIEEIKNFNFPGSHATFPEYFIFNNKNGEIHFNHKNHVIKESYTSQGKCENCHNEGGFSRFFNDNESVMKIAHTLCKDCHKTSENPNAPTKCEGCHRKPAVADKDE